MSSSAYFAPPLPNRRPIPHCYASAPSPSTRRSLRVSADHSLPAEASLYEVLGIRAGATLPEIKSAYRRLARVLHPDIASSRDEDGGAAASGSDFIQLQAAYATLSDPEKRAMYDSSLFRRRMTVASVGGCYGHAASPRRRTWETDQCW